MASKALSPVTDGTINTEKNYLFRIEDFMFRDGIFELVKAFFTKGYLIFVVTNQSGLARGYYTEEQYQYLTAWMIGQFRDMGIIIAKVYHCPHHPDITGACSCRKPAPGMLLKAIDEYGLDPALCVMIGDRELDLEAGRRAGIGQIDKVKETGKLDLKNVVIH